MVQKVADMADFEAGAFGDLLVGQVFVKFKADEFAAAFVQSVEAQADEADAFPAGNGFIGERLGVGRFGGGGGRGVIGSGGGGERDDFVGAAADVDGEVVHG